MGVFIVYEVVFNQCYVRCDDNAAIALGPNGKTVGIAHDSSAIISRCDEDLPGWTGQGEDDTMIA